jgi:hypothetical protein
MKTPFAKEPGAHSKPQGFDSTSANDQPFPEPLDFPPDRGIRVKEIR